MSDLVLPSPIGALGLGRSVYVMAAGGTPPYIYQLKRNGAGGSIVTQEDGSVTYTAPASIDHNGNYVETILVTDNEGDKSSLELIVGDYLTILCDIISHELGMPGRVYIGSQKFEMPKDDRMFVVVDLAAVQLMGNNVEYEIIDNVYSEIKTVNACATVSVNIFSRGTEALTRHFEVLTALTSTYSQQQQARNGFRVSTLLTSPQIQNLSEVDGNSTLYRFHLEISVFHSDRKITAVDYADSFQIASKIND